MLDQKLKVLEYCIDPGASSSNCGALCGSRSGNPVELVLNVVSHPGSKLWSSALYHADQGASQAMAIGA